MAAKKREIYARAAVQLRGHERPTIAEQKCPGAMGLYLFLLLHARGEETWGSVSELIAYASWGAPLAYRKKQAEALIVAGLVVRQDDGRLHIVKYEEHNDTPDVIEENRKKARKRKQDERDRDREWVEGHADVTRDTRVTGGVTTASVTISPSVSTSGSVSVSRSDLPDRSPTPRVWGRGAPAERALEVFADAITAVTGEPFIVGPAMWLRDDICALLNRRAPQGSLDEALKWLGDTVQDWVRADPDCHDRKPSKLTDWLNAKRPDRRRKTGPRAVAVQSMDGACFKIPEGF